MNYYSTIEFSEQTQAFIDRFNENQFWDALADRLAVRNLVEQVGEEAFKKWIGWSVAANCLN